MALVGVAFGSAATFAPGQNWGRKAMRWAMLGLGGLIPLLACLAWFAARCGVHDLWTTLFVFGPEYLARSRASVSLPCLLKAFGRIALLPTLALIPAACVGVWSTRRARGTSLACAIAVAWWAALSLAIYLWQWKFHSVHSLPIIAPLSVAAAAGFAGRCHGRRLPNALTWPLVAAIALPCAIAAARNATYLWNGNDPGTPAHALGLALEARSAPGDRIFVWGGDTLVYVRAERVSCSRFINAGFLFVPWKSVDYRSIFLREFREHPPRFVVLVKEKRGSCEAYFPIR